MVVASEKLIATFINIFSVSQGSNKYRNRLQIKLKLVLF